MAHCDWNLYLFVATTNEPFVSYNAFKMSDKDKLILRIKDNPRTVGLWRVKGKTPKAQQYLWQRTQHGVDL